jgi:hypothetical protein
MVLAAQADASCWEAVKAKLLGLEKQCREWRVVCLLLALLSLTPILDTITDLWVLGSFILSEWYISAAFTGIVLWVNWRFALLFAALHPQPRLKVRVFCTERVLTVPDMSDRNRSCCAELTLTVPDIAY